MIEISEQVRAQIHKHAKMALPQECCGVLIESDEGVSYFPCRNLSKGALHFMMDPEDLWRAEDAGTPRAIVHSHPSRLPNPSQADRVGCFLSGLPWLIVGYPTLLESWVLPEAYEVPYEEREFSYGVLDCYSLSQDFYRREFGIVLPSRQKFGDEWEWWFKGKDLYSLANWATADFHPVRDGTAGRYGDLHLIQIGKSLVANHLAIQLNGGIILHHYQNHLSGKTVYGGYWAKNTLHTERHRSRA